MDKQKSIDIRCEKANDIIAQSPAFIMKYGILFISTSLVLLICIIAVIPFKRTINIWGTIVTEPKDHVVRSQNAGTIYLKRVPQYIHKNNEIAWLYTDDTLKTIKAPASGKLFTTYIDNKEVVPGDVLFIIRPEVIDTYYIEAEIPVSQESWLTVGDPVFIDSDSLRLEGIIYKKIYARSTTNNNAILIKFKLIHNNYEFLKSNRVFIGQLIFNKQSYVAQILKN